MTFRTLVLVAAWIAVALGFAQGAFDFLPDAPPPPDGRDLVRAGWEHVESGDFARGINDLRRASAAVGETAEVLIGLGQAYFSLGDLTRAEHTLALGVVRRESELAAGAPTRTVADELAGTSIVVRTTPVIAVGAAEVSLPIESRAPESDPALAPDTPAPRDRLLCLGHYRLARVTAAQAADELDLDDDAPLIARHDPSSSDSLLLPVLRKIADAVDSEDDRARLALSRSRAHLRAAADADPTHAPTLAALRALGDVRADNTPELPSPR